MLLMIPVKVADLGKKPGETRKRKRSKIENVFAQNIILVIKVKLPRDVTEHKLFGGILRTSINYELNLIL